MLLKNPCILIADIESLNFLQGVLHDDIADKLKEVITGKGRLTADDLDSFLPNLTDRLGKYILLQNGGMELLNGIVD